MSMGYLEPNDVLRDKARTKLTGNWGHAITVIIVQLIILSIIGAVPSIGPIASLVVVGAFEYGVSKFYLKLIRESKAPAIETLFDGFKIFVETFLLHILQSIYIFLWSLLFIIPGIVAAISYSQAYFIMLDDSSINASDAIGKSKKIMMGHKGKYFMLGLSFIGWTIVSIITFGIGFIWLIPYMKATYAEFYQDLKEKLDYQANPVYNN